MGVSEPPVNPWSLTERVKVTSAADEMEYQVSAAESRRLPFSVMAGSCTLQKKVSDFPVPNYSRPGKVWLVTSRLGTGKSITFFYSVK
jgi:hypothetical protein